MTIRIGSLQALACLAFVLLTAACENERTADTESLADAGIPLIVRMEGSCPYAPFLSPCWQEIANKQGCFFWNLDHYHEQERISWSWTGECADGLAGGAGTLKKRVRSGLFAGRSEYSESGQFANGKRIEIWVYESRGYATERRYKDGFLNGTTAVRTEDGLIRSESWYEDGRPIGTWINRDSEGELWKKVTYANGRRNGNWFQRDSRGFTSEGTYVDGQRNGDWIVRAEPGSIISEGAYLDDKKSGDWTFHFPNGSMSEGAYVGGKRHGTWTLHQPDGQSRAVHYENGQVRENRPRATTDIPLVVGIEGSCADLLESQACWRELTDQPDCYFWDEDFYASGASSWSGSCLDGLADGAGTLEVNRGFSLFGGNTYSYSGTFVAGKRNGEWLRKHSAESEAGQFVDGLRNGLSIVRNERGQVIEISSYEDGKLSGYRMVRNFRGELLREGIYVNGRKNGEWIYGRLHGFTEQGPYVNGMRNGDWVVRYEGATFAEGPYVNDRRHGNWLYRHSDGSVAQGLFASGKRDGTWILRHPSGHTETLQYQAGVWN